MHTNIMGFNFQPAYYRQLFAAITGKSFYKINIKFNLKYILFHVKKIFLSVLKSFFSTYFI